MDDLAIKNRYFQKFVKVMFQRLQEGHKKYGDDWRRKDNLKEMEDELYDIANYAFLQWLKLNYAKKDERKRNKK